MPAENMPMAPLAVEVRHAPDGAAVCALAGDLDIESLEPAREALDRLIAERPRILVVDLDRIDFCDSSGLNLLLQARMSAVDSGLSLHLAALSGNVRHLLELTGAKAVFTIHDTVDEALSATG
ncbi:STAS domain-containing protein [Kitasatospora sp. NPDC088391]|uniref:STAS domain-containing protein n=1 Tax=Kitasatospora sp. NPDC088391 TaxID=3364074 RepID=UPI0038129AC7